MAVESSLLSRKPKGLYEGNSNRVGERSNPPSCRNKRERSVKDAKLELSSNTKLCFVSFRRANHNSCRFSRDSKNDKSDSRVKQKEVMKIPSLSCLLLTHILQVWSPVGVFSIGLFTVPRYLPISEVGAGPRCCTEGSAIFLGGIGSNPPRGNPLIFEVGFGEVIFDYPPSLKIFLFHARSQTTDWKGAGNSEKSGAKYPSQGRNVCRTSAYRVAPLFEGRHSVKRKSLRGEVRRNVMTPEPFLQDFQISNAGKKTRSPSDDLTNRKVRKKRGDEGPRKRNGFLPTGSGVRSAARNW